MDLDLQPGWEKKALIIIVVIALIVVVYANNPFKSNPNVVVDNNSTATSPAPAPTPPQNVVPTNNSTNNTNITNTSGNFQISADQAKQIATAANSGYTAGQPTKGNITINNNNFSVWIVPLTQGTKSKNEYVNAATGVIVGEQIISS